MRVLILLNQLINQVSLLSAGCILLLAFADGKINFYPWNCGHSIARFQKRFVGESEGADAGHVDDNGCDHDVFDCIQV